MKTKILPVTNVNQAFYDGIWWLRSAGIKADSRNGPVIRAPGPVITEYSNPRERLLFNPVRDANPVFHLMEAIWMLAGENNIQWLLQFNSAFGAYAEDDGEMHGAYGHRWRNTLGFDQIEAVIRMLIRDPASRQAVIQMWSAQIHGMNDLLGNWNDRPCNTHLYFEVADGRLNMTICCRSNDMLWGAYGANAVHFSILQEVIAHGVGVPVGMMYQFSNNFHVYTEREQIKALWETPPQYSYDMYTIFEEEDGEAARNRPILSLSESVSELLRDCERLVAGETSFHTAFMWQVALPLMKSYLARKADPGGETWRAHLANVPKCDWKLAYQQWTDRRAK